jgi:hypothetical protein
MPSSIRDIPTPILYHHSTNERSISPQALEAGVYTINNHFRELDNRLTTLEVLASGAETENRRLRQFMTWLAEQHPDVLDEFSNTVTVAKKLDGAKETQ